VDDAAERLTRHGPNRIEPHAARSALAELALRLRNPLILILLAAGALSALAGQVGNFVIILAMVVLSVGLDFVQEHRAQRAVDKLRESVALRCTVLRDGHEQALPIAELVPGDVVLLAAGDRVPADGWLLRSRDLFVNQGLLTGESFPVEKRAEPPTEPVQEMQQASHALFMGTAVIGGAGRMRVAATGADTALGAIAHTIDRAPSRTAFEASTQAFGNFIMRITLALVLFVVLVNAYWQRPLLESVLFAVALAVGLTPELLPMVVSVTLARGAQQLARKRVIVKRLTAIHDLGAMDVLCTDKTGTLTQARIQLEQCVAANGSPSARVLQLAYLNSVFESGLHSPLDEAVLARRDDVDAAGWAKIDEVPFDFERRRVSVLIERGAERWLVVKGAPDDVLQSCRFVERPEAAQPLDAAPRTAPIDEAARAALRAQCDAFEDQGHRTLAVAWRAVGPDHAHADLRDETELVFAGFAVFVDPPKPDAGRALAELVASGVAVKIVSGDSERVTLHLCNDLGIPVQGLLTGREIANLDDAALRAQLAKVNLFCRVNPMQKERIVGAYRARGHVVGYLGDGINDAPPLRAANVGLSVESGVDVAKEVADIVMQGHDLRVLHQGVLEGRRTVVNILKYMMMGTSSNFGNMLSMALAALFLPFLPMLPVQILLNNFLYDLSEAALPLDRVDAEELRRPREIDMAFIGRFMAVFGPISSLFDALTFALLLWLLQADERLFQTGWFIESLMTQVLVIFVIRTRRRPWASRPSAVLLAASLGVVGIAGVLPFTPLGAPFHFALPPPQLFAMLLLLVPAYLLLVESAKRVFYRALRRRAGHRRRS
jgi:P-type Mg2+ transporter